MDRGTKEGLVYKRDWDQSHNIVEVILMERLALLKEIGLFPLNILESS